MSTLGGHGVRLVACWAVCLLVAQASAQSVTTEQQAWLDDHGPIRFGFDAAYAPFEFVDEQGVPSGIHLDLMDRIEVNLDVTIEAVPFDNFSRMLEALEAGEIDVVGALNPTPERDLVMDFSRPYMQINSVFFVADPDLQTVSDLSGKRVAVVSGFHSADWLQDNHPEMEFVFYDDLEAALDAVSLGDVAATFEEVSAAGYLIRNKGLTNVRILATGSLLQEQWVFAVPEGEQELLAIVNAGLDSIPEGEWTKIYEYWTGYDLGIHRSSPEDLGPLERRILLGVAGILLAVALWIMTLQIQVRSRTRELRDQLALRKEAEEAATRLNEELEKRVAARTKALERTNRELGSFAQTVSHDLQNPLSAVNLNLARLRHGLIEDHPELLAVVERIEVTTDRMAELIRATLDYSQAAAEAPMEDLDLNEVMGEVRTVVEPLLRDVGGTLDMAPMPHVLGNRTLLVQLFVNLVGNGLKFHRDEPPVVLVRSRNDDGLAHIEVEDNGMGFDDEQFEQMLEPFRRLEQGQGRDGHGIGLSVCARIVERHHGTFSAQGVPGRGATFFVALPLA